MTVKEAGAYLKIPVSTLYELVRKGRIHGVKVGRQWRFAGGVISDYLHGVQNNRQHPLAEKRRHPRIKTEIPAGLTGLLSTTSNLEREGMIRNLSEGGAFFTLQDGGLEAGDPVQIDFALPGREASKTAVEGRLVHRVEHLKTGKTGIGIKFRHLSAELKEVIRNYVG